MKQLLRKDPNEKSDMNVHYKTAHIRILKKAIVKYKAARRAGQHFRAQGLSLQVRELIRGLRKLK